MQQPNFSSVFGHFYLQRIPHDPTLTLRGWDAADEYCLAYFNEHFPDVYHPLILNDQFGALSVALHKHQPTVVNDSFVSQSAFISNLERNQITTLAQVKQLDSLSPLPHAEVVIMKLPKSARYFEYQLQLLNDYLPKNIPVMIAAMDKYLSNTFYQLGTRYLEDAYTSLARKKARLLLGTTSGRSNEATPLSTLDESFFVPEFNLTLFNAPNVYSYGKLDIGTRFFLNNFPGLDDYKHIIDLGCGNGVLGLMALKRHEELQVTFVDESYHAIHSAKNSVSYFLTGNAYDANGESLDSRAQFWVNHCLKGFEEGGYDAVLCNPPFHQQQAVGIQISRQMFRDSKRVLRPDGVLYVIGNRHLGYHIELGKLFPQVSVLASNRRFVLFEARK